MSFKLATIGYAPPPHIPAAQAFMDNLKKFPTKHELLLYSDYDWPSVLKLKQSPEYYFNPEHKETWPHKFALNNLLFFTGMQLAIKSGYSHVIYIESDCRVNKVGWDEIMFDEFFSMGKPLILGGSVVCYNPANWSKLALERWHRMVANNSSRNMPIPTYGWVNSTAKQTPCVFTNGALSVISMAWIQEIFNFGDGCVKLAEHACPWDFRLGNEVGERFFEEAYDVVGHMGCVYSSYGDVITSQQDRQDMLTGGNVCAIHQVKDGWQP